MLKEAINKVVEGKNLSLKEAQQVMGEIMEGRATNAQIACFLTALRMKGETVEEITGFAFAMREKATPVKPKTKFIIDTCGTGGDRAGTFNISTTAAFVVAGCGVKVAKHGNRSVSSHCGSADVLEALGVRLDLPPERIARAIDEVGIGFLFAPALHPAMKHVMPARREMGIRTVFNILGPLSNPAQATAQVVGVYDGTLTSPLAQVLGNLGVRHALVVHGDGLDEVTLTGETVISEYKAGEILNYSISPEDFDLRRASLEDLKGGRVEENAQILKGVLSGERGPKRDAVVLNAAAALIAAERVDNFVEGIKLASQAIDQGKALEKLEELIQFSQQQTTN